MVEIAAVISNAMIVAAVCERLPSGPRTSGIVGSMIGGKMGAVFSARSVWRAWPARSDGSVGGVAGRLFTGGASDGCAIRVPSFLVAYLVLLARVVIWMIRLWQASWYQLRLIDIHPCIDDRSIRGWVYGRYMDMLCLHRCCVQTERQCVSRAFSCYNQRCTVVCKLCFSSF